MKANNWTAEYSRGVREERERILKRFNETLDDIENGEEMEQAFIRFGLFLKTNR